MLFPDPNGAPPDDPLDAREQEVIAALAEQEPDAPLAVALEEARGIPVVRLAGELEMATAGLLRHRIETLLAAHPTSLVFDLTRLAYIDSHGLGLLVQAARRIPGTLAVVAPHERIARLFRATGLDRTLPVFRSLEEAVGALAA